jgi:hypothetical protein
LLARKGRAAVRAGLPGCLGCEEREGELGFQAGWADLPSPIFSSFLIPFSISIFPL